MFICKRDVSPLVRMTHITYGPPSDEYNILFTLDKKLFNPLQVVMYSCIRNLKRKIHFFILQNDFSTDQKDKVREFAINHGEKCDIYDVSSDLFSEFQINRIPNAGYFYLLAHQIIPSSVDRVLYLDVDVLVLKDLGQFYDIDFEGTWLAATNEFDFPTFNKYFVDLLNNKFKYGGGYSSETIFNSGVLLLNIYKFRTEAITIADYKRVHRKEHALTYTGDQMTINAFVRTNIKLLPKLYYNCWIAHTISSIDRFTDPNNSNEIYSYYRLDMSQAHSIVHFTSSYSVKPWNALLSITNEGYKFWNKKNTPSDIKREMDKYLDIWWSYAEHIPVLCYAQLILMGTEYRYQNEQKDSLIKYRKLLLESYAIRVNNKLQHPLPYILDENGNYIAFPISSKSVHFEFWIQNDSLQVSLHFEGQMAKEPTAVRICQKLITLSALERPLKIVDNGWIFGCFYACKDITNTRVASDLMNYLIAISWPVLLQNRLIKDELILKMSKDNSYRCINE